MDRSERRFSTAVLDDPVAAWLFLLPLPLPPPLGSCELDDALSALWLLPLCVFVGLTGSGDLFRGDGGGCVALGREAVESDEELSREDADGFRRCLVDLDDEDETELRDDPVDSRRESWSKALMVSMREALDSSVRDSQSRTGLGFLVKLSKLAMAAFRRLSTRRSADLAGPVETDQHLSAARSASRDGAAHGRPSRTGCPPRSVATSTPDGSWLDPT